ncbi:ABC transporter permease subunit [Listeria aquatica]|uniref:ABC transporter permease subunit n=1 Tax=Listeria aquatica TaxID=1494960 RepID=A0A841ZMI1_9LIST|nr:ABC transporter permease subunit [Listeria aquatica]MBC1521353.1 ABC transporter permease subunit [Listeria aquatica]
MKALLAKEWLEKKRNLKWIWLPVVFAILGLTQPLMVKFLPEILKAVGGIENPDALLQMMGEQTSGTILGQTLASQFDQIGVIIFAVAAMGCVSSDRTSGMLAFMMTKPLRISSYLNVKWISEGITAFCVLLIGYLFSVYYTVALFGEMEWERVVVAFLIYIIWFVFLVGLLILCSASFNSGAASASITVVVAILLMSVTAVGTKWQMFNPAYLSQNAVAFLANGKGLEHFVVCLFWTFGLIVLLYFATFWVMKKKPLQTENH